MNVLYMSELEKEKTEDEDEEEEEDGEIGMMET